MARNGRARHRAGGPGTEERGIALMVTLMIMMLLSALLVGFTTAVIADQRSSGVDRDQTQVYAAAHAGLEKLTSDLANLFSSTYAPSASELSDIASHPPTIPGFSYVAPDGGSGYAITFTPDAHGDPSPADPNGTTIAAGPYQGFLGIVTPYDITVTAQSQSGTEVRMRRTLQTVAVPVFQFGLFSETSLAFHAGDDFSFGGRVHTNGNLYLASGGGSTLTLSDRVTAVGEIVRKYLDNGYATSSSYNGTVKMAKSSGTYRNLGMTEGSVTGDVGSSANEPTWTNLSVGTYNGYIRNGRTGAKQLDLPLVSAGAKPIDLIRRPAPGEDGTSPLVYEQRFYSQASLRILLSDTQADITGLPEAAAGTPVSLESGVFGGAPLAASLGTGNYKTNAGVGLIGGYIKIDVQRADHTWQDVTSEILNLGVAGRNLANGALNTPFTGSNATGTTTVKSVLNACLGTEPQPNAILRLERVKDVPSTSANSTYKYHCATTSGGVVSPTATDYWPLALYDPREGLRRDESGSQNTRYMFVGGVMYYVELDTNNLARWFLGAIGTSGSTAYNNNGYIVYFSDRRNNRNAANQETGEFGYEDIINPSSTSGTSDGTLDASEDVNGNGLLDMYGAKASYAGAYDTLPPGAASPLNGSVAPSTVLTATSDATVATNAEIMRGNRPIFFRRALKLTGGSSLRSEAIGGLTVVAENPIYVEGNYNATSTNTSADPHIAASVIADAVTLLSNSWNDVSSFYRYPHDPGQKAPSNTGYRFAAVTGKNISFPRPGYGEVNLGMDGGAHNLLRLLEDWGSGGTVYYRGSIISFYISRQAIGTFKCCVYTYTPGNRSYAFDSDFLLPSKLPPGTPMFRDVNTLTFRQLLRPTE